MSVATAVECQKRSLPPFAERNLLNIRGSFRLDVGRANYLSPLGGLLPDQVCAIGGRAGHRNAAEIAKTRFHSGINKSGIDLFVELIDDRIGCAPGRAKSIPYACLVPGQDFADRRD